MKLKERLNRAEFLLNWFIEVFDGTYAPHPRRRFKGLSKLMKDFLKNSKQYGKKYKNEVHS